MKEKEVKILIQCYDATLILWEKKKKERNTFFIQWENQNFNVTTYDCTQT